MRRYTVQDVHQCQALTRLDSQIRCSKAIAYSTWLVETQKVLLTH